MVSSRNAVVAADPSVKTTRCPMGRCDGSVLETSVEEEAGTMVPIPWKESSFDMVFGGIASDFKTNNIV